VASGISLRPWISIPSVLIAITPMIAVSLFMETASYWGTGLLTTAFLAGGIESMLKRYRAVSRHITMHRLLSTLARSDTLTGLPNRLSLNEWFVQAVQSSPATDRLAVYCVALDHIQAINDTYGYPVGDALLKAVAERLNRIVAPGDFLIRLNGVKFAIVQFALLQSRQGDLLAQHIVAAIAKPFSIEGQEVSAGACIGYTIASQRGADLDYLLGCADHAIQQAKREASNVASYSQSRWGIKTGQAA
jgi:diguanylate cyclase (GGDEF)-like protein